MNVGRARQVAFSEITAEDIPPTGVDDLCVKLIRISQLTIEYLLHVQASKVCARFIYFQPFFSI